MKTTQTAALRTLDTRTNEVLDGIAIETARDNGVDLDVAIRMLEDEPGETIEMARARGVFLSREQLRDWCRGQA